MKTQEPIDSMTPPQQPIEEEINDEFQWVDFEKDPEEAPISTQETTPPPSLIEN